MLFMSCEAFHGLVSATCLDTQNLCLSHSALDFVPLHTVVSLSGILPMHVHLASSYSAFSFSTQGFTVNCLAPFSLPLDVLLASSHQHHVLSMFVCIFVSFLAHELSKDRGSFAVPDTPQTFRTSIGLTSAFRESHGYLSNILMQVFTALPIML